MRPTIALAVAALLSTAITAQTTLPQNKKELWDGSTEYTSRGSVGSDVGFVSMAFPFGAIAGLKTVTRAYYVVQDQDQSTQEPWNLKHGGLTAAGDPDYTKFAMLGGPFSIAVSTGIGAWAITHNWNSTGTAAPKPVTIPNDRWHFAWQFTKKTNWTTDGLGIHMSQANTGLPNSANTPLCYTGGYHREMNRVEGNNPRLNDDLGQSTGPNNTFADLTRAWKLDLGFVEVALTGGVENKAYNGTCANPNFGLGGLDPDFNDMGKGQPARMDNFAWRVNAPTAYAGGFAFLISSTASFQKGIPTPFGNLYVNFTGDFLFGALALLPFPTVLDAQGSSTLVFTLPAAIRKDVASLPSWAAQVLVIKTGQAAKLSSLHTFRPWKDAKLANVTGFTAGKADTTTNVTIPRPAGVPQRLYVRNDGPGVLTIDEYVGGKVARSFVINERTAGREFVSPAGQKWVVKGNLTKKQTEFYYRWNY